MPSSCRSFGSAVELLFLRFPLSEERLTPAVTDRRLPSTERRIIQRHTATCEAVHTREKNLACSQAIIGSDVSVSAPSIARDRLNRLRRFDADSRISNVGIATGSVASGQARSGLSATSLQHS